MREMKDSGIEWIGEVPVDWNVKPIRSNMVEVTEKNILGNVKQALKFTYGQIVPKANFDADADDYVATTILNYTVVEPGTIVLNGLNLNFDFVTQRVGLVRELGTITSAYLAFKPIDNHTLSSEFITYLLKSYDTCKAFHNMGGGVRKILNFSELKKVYIVYPSFPEQCKIVNFLDTKCAEMNTLSSDILTQIETLEQYKRSVISEAVTRGLDPNVPMKDSGIAWVKQIPKHWAVIPSKYLFHNSDTRKYPSDEQLTASQRHGIITQREYMERENAKVVFATQGLDNWKHVKPNDFVISLRSFQGGLEMSETTGCITWHYVVLEASKPIYPPFYKWLFKSVQYINALQGTCNFIRDGQDLRFSNFSKVPLYEPPMDEQKAIADYLDAKCSEIDQVIAQKQEQLDILADYKKSLIYEYVTGKKEVPGS